MTVAYCTECDWERRTGEATSREELNRAMIDHYSTTGHSPIETADRADGPSRTDDPQPTI